MKKKYNHPYHDMYDDISRKYGVDPGGGFWLERKEQSRRAQSVCREYIRVVETIGAKTGFNTNAPERFYEQAKELSEKLEKKIEDTRRPKANAEFLRQANWALFTKLDWLEAKENLERMVF